MIASGWSFETAVRTLGQEARGEPLPGQQAVAAVIVNRVHDGRWGTSLSSVCLANRKIKGQVGQGFQFSGWRGQDANFDWATGLEDTDSALLPLRHVLEAAIAGVDPTKGALFYYAASIPTPFWALPNVTPVMRRLGQFGHQYFLTDRP